MSGGAKCWLGIDFSGNDKNWRAGTPRNVWIAEVHGTADDLSLNALRPVQHLEGTGEPFERLSNRLGRRDFAAAGIDAPFSIPAAYLPSGGWEALLATVNQLPLRTRPFPRGDEFIAAVTKGAALPEKKPLRLTEQAWRGQARSTLWYKPRGGAPFTASCLKLIASSGLDCWPWVEYPGPLLVEAFPAAQLRTWKLPHQRYTNREPHHAENRRIIVDVVARRVACRSDDLELLQGNADALDAVICCFAALAVTEGRLASARGDQGNGEGWIAVHR